MRCCLSVQRYQRQRLRTQASALTENLQSERRVVNDAHIAQQRTLSRQRMAQKHKARRKAHDAHRQQRGCSCSSVSVRCSPTHVNNDNHVNHVCSGGNGDDGTASAAAASPSAGTQRQRSVHRQQRGCSCSSISGSGKSDNMTVYKGAALQRRAMLLICAEVSATAIAHSSLCAY